MKTLTIADTVSRQREYFNSGATRSYESRVACLQQLHQAVKQHAKALETALQQDLGKPEFEAFLTETGFSQHEISETLRKLKGWMRPKRVRTSLMVQPARSTVYHQPLGVNLIIAPYNYPVNLSLSPMIAAIAAGNTVVLKTSEITPHVSAAIETMLDQHLDPRHVAFIGGGVDETTQLLAQKFDHIFFTGSPRVGRIVMMAAARQLTPVTLELGGKSPCIVHHDADLDLAVKRIVNGKFLNAGQTCIAPDYVMVHQDVKDVLLQKMQRRIENCYGVDPASSPDYGRIVSDSQFQRIVGLIDQSKVVIGGHSNPATRFIAPTLMRDCTLQDKVMQEEIFGPLLPVLDYQAIDEVYQVVAQLPQHPLACYIFSASKAIQRQLIDNIQFGGGCINHCVMQVANSYLPFGGVGDSGIGAYHGYAGFQCFSHQKSILKAATWLDLSVLYPPYKGKIRHLRSIMK